MTHASIILVIVWSYVFINKMDSTPQGGGEPAIICIGGAIAIAVFDACGTRVNRMPVTPERILEAIQKKS